MSTDIPLGNDLTGQVAIVTGGGRGIGRAIALGLAKAGAAVMVSARSTNEIEETAEMIRAAGGKATACAADVSDLAAVKAMLAATEAELGAPSILVNNAGGGVPGSSGPFEKIEPEGITAGIERNLVAAMILSRLVLPGMLERKRGHIINVASGAGMLGMPFIAPYSVAKTGVIRFSEVLGFEMLGRGVAVFAITPGNVLTKLTQPMMPALDTMIEAMPAGAPWIYPPGHELEPVGWYPPERAADLCNFLVSGKADVLTGRFFSVHYDEAAILANAERVVADELYTLRVPTLNGLEPALYYRNPEDVRASAAAK
ncbi:SDR family oxidoreductase [Novosphingobium sp. MMS21-SN21R]|uniref:SDR family NAD(P)-dependent oxidoreductase n=1 Tax=Novosphingobium sp. MMS21-SN21R TaxID=2969298 RepID=UPI002886F956|nr:SDR family oxidoreductase [Novosphingobium sp. MMS21-SN21R]MDT0509778.1 SDR family oxidoreductase [Novosphingobium sp. MMS21-SN21R]